MECIIGTYVYNNQSNLPYFFDSLDVLLNVFTKIKLIIVYDKSIDNSIDMITNYNNSKIIKTLIYNDNKVIGLARTKRTEHVNNLLLNEIYTTLDINSDYFIITDMNEYTNDVQIDVDTIRYAFTITNDWDSISFLRNGKYNNISSLSIQPYVYSVFHFKKYNNVMNYMKKYMMDLIEDYKNNNMNLIEVLSAYNGFGIYKKSKFINCTFDSMIHKELFPEGSIENEQSILNEEITDVLKNDSEFRKYNLEAINKNNSKIRICLKDLFKLK